MDAQSVFPSNVVHTQVVIDSLVRKHQAQLLRVNTEVLPLDVPLEVSLIISLQLVLKLLNLRVYWSWLGLDLNLLLLVTLIS